MSGLIIALIVVYLLFGFGLMIGSRVADDGPIGDVLSVLFWPLGAGYIIGRTDKNLKDQN